MTDYCVTFMIGSNESEPEQFKVIVEDCSDFMGGDELAEAAAFYTACDEFPRDEITWIETRPASKDDYLGLVQISDAVWAG